MTLLSDPAYLGFEIGGSALLGFLVGYATKTVVKFVAIVLGVQVAILAALASDGTVSVDWYRLSNRLADPALGQYLPGEAVALAGGLPIGGGFALGALVGFKRG